MKASELRINNYLYNDGVVVKIDARTIFDIWDDKGLKNYKPIPLTEEWLLKFGFNGECESFHMEGITIEEVSDGGKWVVYMFDEYHAVECSLAIVQHVHQLQNLYFALTGEELTL